MANQNCGEVLGLGIGNNGSTHSLIIPDCSTDNGHHPELKPSTSGHHSIPITVGVCFSKEILPLWSIEFGLQYHLLRSEITNTIGSLSYVKKIRSNYLGIAMAMCYNFMRMNYTNMYVSGGVSLDIPLGTSIVGDPIAKSIKYPLSVSPYIGLEFEYRMTSSLRLYIQPTLNYHIMKKSEYPILWQDRPISFELPIGIRISW